MSLRVWLPLNGSLIQQGISNLSAPSNNTLTLQDSGKIGKCYSGQAVYHINEEILGNVWSLCAWIKADTWYSANNIILCKNINDGSNYQFYFSIIGGTSFGIGANSSGTATVAYTFNTNTWYHVSATYDGSTYRLYVNGEEKKNGTITNTFVSGMNNIGINCRSSNTAGTSRWIGDTSVHYINDVRVYDHCLSAAEIKEIAQGLVLHYKLDGFQGGYGNPNIIVTHSNAGVDGTGTSGWSAAGTGWSNSFVSATGATGGYAIRCTYANTSQTSGGIHHPTGIDKTTLTTGDIYTLSARIRTSKACVVTFQNELMTTGHSINTTTEWQTYTYTCAIDTSKTYQSNIMYVRAADAVQNMWIECDWIKLEKGTAATPWQPSGVIGTAIQDSSGYNHNGSILNDVLISSDTPRYSTSTNLVAGNSAINCGRGGMVTDSITVNLWLKSSAWNNPISCTEGGGWNFESNGDGFRFPVYLAGVGYKATGVTTTTRAQLCNNQWHMITGVYDRLNQKIRVYIDANLEYEENTNSSALIGYHSSNVIWIGAEASGSATAIGSNGMAGLFSDFRIYCTPLLDTDIKQLYNVGMKVDKNHNIHTYELHQKDENKLHKTGVLCNSNFNEINNLFNLLYDKQLYIEPDGSCWIRIFHHANCDTKLFASSDTFTTSVYKDADRWFNVSLCNKVNKWELMVKSMPTAGGTETKYRWIQTKNPMTAAYADVAAASVTKVTGNGYASYGWGGLYYIGSNTYLSTNNGTNGNWWGAVGAWANHQGGIPGWTTVITTGYEDVYLRIDNLDQVNLHAKNIKAGMWTANQFIEK